MSHRDISRPSTPAPRTPLYSNQRTRQPVSRNHRGRGVWYIAGFLLIALVFGFSLFFARASITVVPKSQELTINERISAFKKPVTEGLRFDSMIVSGEESVVLTSETKQVVEEPARGRVRIVNEHSGESQALRIDTRLVDQAGLIYKTKEKVTVPGMKTENGTKIPGTVEVEIYADASGPAGNKDVSDVRLGILGFKEAGSDKFETVYAQTITPLSGGFVGERYVIGEEQENQEIAKLTTQMYESLKAKARAQMPEQVTAPENLMTLFETSFSTTSTPEGSVVLTFSGSLFSVMFNTTELEHYFIENLMVDIAPGSVHIANIDSLVFSYVEPELQTVNPPLLENLLLDFQDTLQIEFVVNHEALVFDLVGKKRKEFNSVVMNHSGIASASLSLTPFWKSRLPERDEDISVTVEKVFNIDQSEDM